MPSSRRGDLAHVHLVGSVNQVQRAGVRVHRGQRPVVGDTRAAEQLDRAIDHVGRDARRDHLDRGDLGLRVLLADGVHHPRGLHRQQARLFDLHARLGDSFLHDALVGERLLERDAHLGAHAHEVERAFRHADRAHAMVNAAGPEPCLRNRETASLFAEEVLLRDAHVLPQRLAVPATFGVTEHGQAAPHGDTGSVHRDEDHRLPVIRVGVGIGDAHEHREFAARVERAAREPLVAVDHVVVALAFDARRDVGRIR